MQLTPRILFGKDPLVNPQPSQFAISPCGQFVSYLQAAKGSTSLNLWLFDVATQTINCVCSSAAIAADSEDVAELTVAESAERERRRQFTFGISQYVWHPQDAALILFADGNAYRVNLDSAINGDTAAKPVVLTDKRFRQSAFTLSPKGNFLSFVRAGDLYLQRLGADGAQDEPIRVTTDGSETVSNGIADFLAAEEMHRFSGHWWSQDEAYVLFTRVDDAAVPPSHRLEIDALASRTVSQRYPFAGGPNPDTQLMRYALDTHAQTKVWESSDAEPYLARVNGAENRWIIHTQDRLQQNLTVQSQSYEETDPTAWQPIYAAQAATWINLTDDFFEINDGTYLLSTETQQTDPHGGRQLIRIDQTDAIHRTKVLRGPTHINRLLTADGNLAYVLGWHESPIDNHLFAVNLDSGDCQQITYGEGWHDCIVDIERSRFLDIFSNAATPKQVTLTSLTDNGTSHQLLCDTITNDHPYFPWWPTHAQPEYGHIEAADGQRLYYRLTPPASIATQHPVIVYVYGGPGAQKVRNEWPSLLLQLFAHHGFGVLELDNRGSTNRGAAFEAPIYQKMGGVEISDQIQGLDILDDIAWADRQRVGVFGHSYGGYMSLMCLCLAGGHFKAGVAVAPVCSWELYDTHYTERYMGLPQEQPEAYANSSVLRHLPKLNNPLLLIHGMADDNVLFSHSTQIMSALQQHNIPFELMTYPGAKHSMQEPHVSMHRFALILDFFKRSL